MNTISTNKYGVSEALQFHHIEAFLKQLRTARYSEVTLCKKRYVLTAFARWMKDQNITLAQLDESAIAAFVKRLAVPPPARVQFELSVLRLLLTYLRCQAEVPLAARSDESEIDSINCRYVD